MPEVPGDEVEEGEDMIKVEECVWMLVTLAAIWGASVIIYAVWRATE
jgi:hypothetical protein